LGFEDGLNVYIYVQNNPISFFDPLGLTSWPVCGPVTSEFGRRRDPKTGQRKEHNGLDIGIPHGTTIVATDSGIVSRVGQASSGENRIEVRHSDGSTSVYRHVTADVQRGQFVPEGTPIGVTDSSGYQTGPHLHYEYKDAQNKPVDPATHLPSQCGPCY
jgi:murein DD-endopeptidase MepM/ murein hydrolase activator NlpD